jgi:chromosome partitioning protein
VRAIEIEAGVPDKTLKRCLNGEREIPERHIQAIEDVLKQFGYTAK